MPQASPSDDQRLTAGQLRSLWRTASRDRGWRFPDDWWTPAVDAVTEAVLGGGDIAERCTRLGSARARAGVSMDETLTDVIAMASLVRSLQAHPTHLHDPNVTEIEVVELVKAAAIGWAEKAPGRASGPDGTVNGLADCSYLSMRLSEVAAEAEGGGQRLSESFALVVVSLLKPNHDGDMVRGLQERVQRWDHTVQMSQVADDVRTVFCSGETIAEAGPTRAIILAPRTPQLTAHIAALRGLIEERHHADSPAPMVGIWVEGLPDSLPQARLLLDDLRR